MARGALVILLPAAAVVGALGWAGVELIKRTEMLSSGFWGGWICLMGALSILTASVVWWGVEHDRVTAYMRKKHWAYEMAKKKADEGDSLENLPGSISSSLTIRDLSERAAHVERFDDAVERWRDTMNRFDRPPFENGTCAWILSRTTPTDRLHGPVHALREIQADVSVFLDEEPR